MTPLLRKLKHLPTTLLVGRTLLGLAITTCANPLTLYAWDWVPSEREIQRYRKSWNPFSHGPILLQAVDIQPEGQLSIREFIFTQIGEHSYGNRLSLPTERKNGPVHLYAVSPSVNTAYGFTDHIELGIAASLNSFWARDSRARGGPGTTGTGLGDTSLIMKYTPERPRAGSASA